MILTKYIKVKITDSNYDHYFILGYDASIGDIVKVPVSLLTSGSNAAILCRCDGCGGEKKVIYKNYLKYKIEQWGDYRCRKCSDNIRIQSLMDNYGVNCPIMDININKKYKQTLKNRYGVDNAKKIKPKK